MRAALLLFIFTVTANAQWQIQDSHTTADLRGIDNVGNGIAWASGSNGTVLRTTDNGTTWQRCATPPDADKLDFRGVQAFDAQTAIVMSSGKGDLSRLYKTTDGCKTWKLVFTNPDKDGFWDAVKFADRLHGFILGDPVTVSGSNTKRVAFKQTIDGGKSWISWERKVQDFALGDDVASFAASNSALAVFNKFEAAVAIGGKGGSAIGFPGNQDFAADRHFCTGCPTVSDRKRTSKLDTWWELAGPFPQTDTGGIFSIALNGDRIVAVGGDYREPQSTEKTAAYMACNVGDTLHTAATPPHGYRSAVAYDAATKTWITVGPNGTDISTDDGRNWRALRPSAGDAPDADKNWNALSLPFVVGPKGRIGVLDAQALEAK